MPDGTEVVVNATSIGLHPDGGARLDLDPDTSARGWSSLTSSPTRRGPHCSGTPRPAAARTVDGLGMLVEQAVLGIRLWTGVDADRAVLRSALVAVFGATASGPP